MKKYTTTEYCLNCLGCNRLELEEFKGVYRCKNRVEVKNERENIGKVQRTI